MKRWNHRLREEEKKYLERKAKCEKFHKAKVKIVAISKFKDVGDGE